MPESSNPSVNADQIQYWNDKAGETWARFQDQLDRQIQPLGQAAIRALAPRLGERIVDIGCGCGQTTLELAAEVGTHGFVLGADISRPMLDVAIARPRASGNPRIEFRLLDAQSDDLAAVGGGAFDAAFSRFGVMFFSDPVAAFANIRKALKPNGRLGFVCWRPLQENHWMRRPMEAALPFLPPMPPSDPTAPGPFAFADAARVTTMLAAAGFSGISSTPFDALIGSGDLEQTLQLMFKVGPLGAALREHPECKDQVAAAVKAALEPYVTPAGVVLPAAVWIFLARNG